MNPYVKPAYLGKIWFDQKSVLLWLSLFSFSFEFAFAWLLFEADFNSVFESVVNMLPTSLMNFIGVTVGGEYYGSQLLAFGYSHPLILISLSLMPISISSRYIAGETEHKTIDLLLSRSFHRSVVPTHLFLFLVFAIAIQSLSLYAGTMLGYYLFSLNIDLYGYFKVVSVTFNFFLSMGAISLFISIFHREKGKAIARTVSFFVLLYFYDTVIRLNKSLEFLTDYSYFNLYQPGKLLRGQADISTILILLIIITCLFFSLSVYRFTKSDL